MSTMGGGRTAGPQLLQNAVSANANGTAMNVITPSGGSYAVAGFQISGTFSATVHFEGTIDGSNWVSIEAYEVDDSSTLVTSATTAGVFRATVLGLKQVRARVAWTSGTSVTVWGTLVA